MNCKEVEKCVCVRVSGCASVGVHKRASMILMSVFKRWILIAGAGRQQRSSSACQKHTQAAETNSVTQHPPTPQKQQLSG